MIRLKKWRDHDATQPVAQIHRDFVCLTIIVTPCRALAETPSINLKLMPCLTIQGKSIEMISSVNLKLNKTIDFNRRSVVSQRLDDINPVISQRRRSSRLSSAGSNREAGSSGVRCGRSNSIRSNSNRGSSTNIQRGSSIRESSGRGTNSNRSSARMYHHRANPVNVTRTTTMTTTTTTAANIIEYGVECVNNKVQKQIERMFTDVAKDETTCSFAVRCLGSMPLHSKVTSLFELQDPLRQLYIAGTGHNVSFLYGFCHKTIYLLDK